ncbi:hypothetical protein [Halorubellus sp. PRR65]|uniref:hypothetical protein n=1 Tax=Halorubellus sp. PRR65 TaxID=3098148 RepID=UPI002B25D338|nr:hypothetical protein [Halorubellus sp. PRR65]
MSGWLSVNGRVDDTDVDEGAEVDGDVDDPELGDADEGRLRTDGGTDDDAAEIKQLLSEGDDDGGLADAVTGEDEDDEYEGGPAMDFGLKLGAPFALVAVGLLFVGPQPLLEFDPTGRYVIDTLDVGGPGNIVYISAATLALSFLAGLLYPSVADDLDADDDFKMDLGLGLSLPTVAVMGLGVLFFMFWPAVFALLNGALVEALLTVVVAVVLVAIAVAGSVVTLVVAAVATLYFVGPALVGSYVGGFIGERIAT